MEEGKGGGGGGGKNVFCILICIVKVVMLDIILVCFYLC